MIEPSVGLNERFLVSYLIPYAPVKSEKLPLCFFKLSEAESKVLRSS